MAAGNRSLSTDPDDRVCRIGDAKAMVDDMNKRVGAALAKVMEDGNESRMALRQGVANDTADALKVVQDDLAEIEQQMQRLLWAQTWSGRWYRVHMWWRAHVQRKTVPPRDDYGFFTPPFLHGITIDGEL